MERFEFNCVFIRIRSERIKFHGGALEREGCHMDFIDRICHNNIFQLSCLSPMEVRICRAPFPCWVF